MHIQVEASPISVSGAAEASTVHATILLDGEMMEVRMTTAEWLALMSNVDLG